MSRFTTMKINIEGKHDRPRTDVFRVVYTLRRAGAVAVLTREDYLLDAGHWRLEPEPSREVFAVTWHDDRMWLTSSGPLRGLECARWETSAYELGAVFRQRCGGSVKESAQWSGERRTIDAWRCELSRDAMKIATDPVTKPGLAGIDFSGTGTLEPLEFGVGVDLERVDGACCPDTDVCFPSADLRITSIRGQ